MKHLKRYETYLNQSNPQFNEISLAEAPEEGRFFCARCKKKLPEKPEYGNPGACGCGVVTGNKVEVASFDSPSGPWVAYYANDKKYDKAEFEGPEAAEGTEGPGCPPGQTYNAETGRCEPDKRPSAGKKSPFAFLSIGECPPGKIFNPKTGACEDAPKPPSWAPKAEPWFLSELVRLLEKHIRPIAAGYSSIAAERWKGKAADPMAGLQTVLREAKTGDLLRACDAIRIFFDRTIGKYPSFYFSEKNLQSYVASSDGKTYSFLNAQFEYLCSMVCKGL